MEQKQTSEIDVVKIMESIREEIKEKGLENEVLPFESIPLPNQTFDIDDGIGPFSSEDFMDANMYLNQFYSVSVWHQIRSTKPVIGPVLTFFKKVNRKLIRFFIEPIVEDQNNVNINVTKSLNQIRNYILEKDNNETDEEEQLKQLSLKVEELLTRVKDLEDENNKLKSNSSVK